MSSSAGSGSPGGRHGRGVTRGRAVVVVLLLGVLGFGLSALPWAGAPVATVLAEQSVRLSGAEAAPVTTAASLAVLATGLAVAIGGRWVTRLCALALVALGVLLAASAVGFVLDPGPRLLAAAAELTGVREIAGDPVVTAWPYVTAALGLLVAASAVLVLRVPTATAAGRRYERAGTGPAPDAGTDDRDDRVRAMDDWDALGRGEDPSASDQR
ncbi:Trp biosynthesis-associated membrane protein [Georgenia sp. H159]|uniref:Trp biosynthesis-associated membrane protein n=1 Tax=Georgenia sp. H159 TaxID=3076115 RepID=UPI002D779E42|nr:Trp biosynthesis-associated membrane protein [Georgenia sp. H159]